MGRVVRKVLNCHPFGIVPGAVVLFLINCTRVPFVGYLQGVVEYEVRYPEIEEKSPALASLLPKTAMCYFRRNEALIEISGALNLFRIAVYSSVKERKVRAFLKILNRRIYTEYDSSEVRKKIEEYPPFTVVEGPDRQKAGEVECRVFKIVFLTSLLPDFDLWVTNEIKAGDVFWYTPFYRVTKGFLAKYQIYHFKVLMEFTLKGVEDKIPPSEVFELDTTYTRVSIEEFENEVNRFLKEMGLTAEESRSDDA